MKDKQFKLAYIMSRFPKISETFILFEILQHERNGIPVEVYPLRREHQPVMHPEAEKIVSRAHFQPLLSLPVLQANLHYVARKPGAYFKALAAALTSTFGNLNRFAGALAYFPMSARFAYLMEQQGIAHIHAHFCNHPAVVAFIIHRLTGIPYSFTAHGSDLHKDKRMLEVKVEESKFAVTVSEFNKKEMLKKCGPRLAEKIHIVRCGIDPEVFKPRETMPPETPFRILCVASFEEVKGHKYLVRACEILHERGIDFVCDLVGEGPVRQQIEQQIAEAGLGDRIIVHGGLPRLEVARLMRAAHVKVLPSVPTNEGKKEGVPVVIMEAMASELPVVSSRLSGIPELVEDQRTGFLLPPRDVAQIADMLEKLHRDRELRERSGRAGRTKVLEEFNLEKSTAYLLELMRQSSEGNRNGRPN